MRIRRWVKVLSEIVWMEMRIAFLEDKAGELVDRINELNKRIEEFERGVADIAKLAEMLSANSMSLLPPNFEMVRDSFKDRDEIKQQISALETVKLSIRASGAIGSRELKSKSHALAEIDQELEKLNGLLEKS